MKPNTLRVLDAVRKLQEKLTKDEGVKATALADDLHLSQPTINRRLNTLVALGLIHRLATLDQ